MLSRLFSFWSGSALGYVERLCIASILKAGHTLDIFSFDPDLAVPAGVNLRDAREIVPRTRSVVAETARWALLSDVFRYEALLRGAGTWIDLDMLLLRPVSEIGEYIFGWQDASTINGAILRLPPDSPCLQKLIALCRSDVVVPPQWSRTQKAYQRLRAVIGRHTPVEKMEWGAIGPQALTRFLIDLRLLHRCQSVDVFYPVSWQQAWHLFEPDAALVENALTANTRAVHFWNDRIKHLKGRAPPPGSFVAKMCEAFNVDVP
jgi:hypothetical protein